MIVEIKRPLRRNVALSEAETTVNRKYAGLIEVRLTSYSSRREVTEVKEEEALKQKIYRAVILSATPITDDDIKKLEEQFTDSNGVLVKQQTPKRVLHRRPDVLRKKRVYEVKIRRISNRVFEALIRCDGGLYVKELITGDEGRTRPSFSEILGTPLTCIALDVLSVEI